MEFPYVKSFYLLNCQIAHFKIQQISEFCKGESSGYLNDRTLVHTAIVPGSNPVLSTSHSVQKICSTQNPQRKFYKCYEL